MDAIALKNDLDEYKKKYRRKLRSVIQQRNAALAARDQTTLCIDELEDDLAATRARLARAKRKLASASNSVHMNARVQAPK